MLLILHIIVTFLETTVVAADYSIMGILCSLAHAIVKPFMFTSASAAAIENGKSFGFDIMVNWILVFFCMTFTDYLWMKATDTQGGRSYFKLIVFTVLSIAAMILLSSMIQREGF